MNTDSAKAPLHPSQYAGFWVRFFAACIDLLVYTPVYIAVKWVTLLALALVYGDPLHVPRLVALWVPETVFGVIALLTYAWFFASRWQGSPGMYILRFHICDTEGNRIGYGRSLWWGITSLFGILFCLAGVIYLMTKVDVNAVNDLMISCIQQQVDMGDCQAEVEKLTGLPYTSYLTLTREATGMAFFLLLIWALSIALPKDKTGFHNIFCGTRFVKGRPPATPCHPAELSLPPLAGG